MADTEMVMSPGEAARRLGVSPSGLRRLAGAYGAVYGDLPKDSSNTARVWPQEAVTRLERARALLAAGQARSIKDALLAVEAGAAPPVEAAVALGQEGRMIEALGVVAARLEALQASNQRLEVEVGELRAELAAARALPASERAATVAEGGDGAKMPDDNGGAAPGEADGPVVRVARWLEQRLRGAR